MKDNYTEEEIGELVKKISEEKNARKLNEYAQSQYEEIRVAVAYNDNTAINTLLYLAHNGEDKAVRDAVIHNLNTPKLTSRRLEIMNKLENERTGPDEILHLFDEYLAMTPTKFERMNPFLMKQYELGASQMEAAFASNPRTPHTVLNDIYEDMMIREAHTPPAPIRAILGAGKGIAKFGAATVLTGVAFTALAPAVATIAGFGLVFGGTALAHHFFADKKILDIYNKNSEFMEKYAASTLIAPEDLDKMIKFGNSATRLALASNPSFGLEPIKKLYVTINKAKEVSEKKDSTNPFFSKNNPRIGHAEKLDIYNAIIQNSCVDEALVHNMIKQLCKSHWTSAGMKDVYPKELELIKNIMNTGLVNIKDQKRLTAATLRIKHAMPFPEHSSVKEPEIPYPEDGESRNIPQEAIDVDKLQHEPEPVFEEPTVEDIAEINEADLNEDFQEDFALEDLSSNPEAAKEQEGFSMLDEIIRKAKDNAKVVREQQMAENLNKMTNEIVQNIAPNLDVPVIDVVENEYEGEM